MSPKLPHSKLQQEEYFQDMNSLTGQTVRPSGRQQSLTSVLKSLSSSSSSSSSDPNPSSTSSLSRTGPTARFMQDLALRSKNRFRSSKRVFIDMADGLALLLMILQAVIWLGLSVGLYIMRSDPLDMTAIYKLMQVAPLFLGLALVIALISSVFLYFFTSSTVHVVSLSVLCFTLYNVASNLPNFPNPFFTSGNFASLITFVFLALYYLRGLKNLPLTCHFLKSASRICWRHHLSLAFVFASYALTIYIYIITWSTSILIIQRSDLRNNFKIAALAYTVCSLMITSAFLRDFLQIWLSRIIYTSTFAYTARPVIVTSLVKRLSLTDEEDLESGSLEETKRVVSRDSMWWCMGTAARSAFHLVIRAFQIHLWILAIVQVFAPQCGPRADPQCVLDVFHVPTAIYGTSYTKSRTFVADTMVDHGMDQISVELYLRTFIYYMISYACGILSLVAGWRCLGCDSAFRFKVTFMLDSVWAMFTTAQPVHFAAIFVAFGIILFFTAIDSVHMILCWSICESPTSVSALEPDLMHLLVTFYHARLDLKRFTGDRINVASSLLKQ